MRLERLADIRIELAGRLKARSAEIEETIFERVQSLAELVEAGDDPEYRAGLRATVAEGFDYALLGIEHGEAWDGPMPPAAVAQARRAAREGISLDTVLRRYAAGDRLVGEFIMEEAADFPRDAMREVLRSQGPHVDRLMAAVASQYMAELEALRRSPSQRRAEIVQRLLARDAPADAFALDYPFDAWHLGLIVTGPRADVAARTLAAGLGREALVVPHAEETAWAWLGGNTPLPTIQVERYVAAGVLGKASVAVGEPRRGLKGWRLTHFEARAAQEVRLKRPQALTRASEVLLLAAILRDDVLATSLRETYCVPLRDLGDSGAVLRETLRAYFDSGFNAAAAAAALGVDRHTVQRRLRKVESVLGRLLHTCHAEVEVALRIGELEEAARHPV